MASATRAATALELSLILADAPLYRFEKDFDHTRAGTESTTALPTTSETTACRLMYFLVLALIAFLHMRFPTRASCSALASDSGC